MGNDEQAINATNAKRAHPAAAILREIADEAAVNPEPHLAFEWWGITSNKWFDSWSLDALFRLVADGQHVRRKPKTVRAEGEVLREAIDSAERIVDRQESGDDVTVAHALLSLVKDE